MRAIALSAGILCLSSVTLLPAPVAAEDLKGRLFLGPGLNILLERKESVLSEFLRYLKLKKTPREIVNLTGLGQKGDQVFVGEDMKLYYSSEKDDGAAYPIGSASRLWKFKVDDDVSFAKVAELSRILDPSGGKVGRKLRVKTSRKRPRAIEAKQANFEFWLDELVFEYDRYNPRRKTEENYPYILQAIETALPDPEHLDRHRLDNLKYLLRYVKTARGMDLVPLRKLVSKLAGRLSEAGVPEPVRLRAAEIKRIVFKKTEGL